MRRKVYADSYERKRDQRIGAVAFIVVNVIVYLVYQWLAGPTYEGSSRIIHASPPLAALLLPWVVNGAVLAWAFLLRPHIGVGYIISFGAILVASVILGAILVASCVISLVVGLPLMAALGEDVGGPFFVIALIGSLLAGLIGFLVFGFRIASKWWTKYE
jgi:hypothetical protein